MDEKESILIVDDDESTRRSLSLVLGRNGYEVEAIGTGRETLQQVRDRSFNVALLDIRLPDMTGIELLASLKELYPDMAVIMVTGYASVDTAILALNKGASAYITKPLNLDEVLIRVERAVEKQHLVRGKRQAEELLRQTNRALQVLSACNGILVHAEDEDKLLQQVCEAITSIGEFPLAWVGYAEHDEGKSVTPVAFSGTGVAYVASLDISSIDNARGCSVVETAIRTQEVVLNRDYLTNPYCASCPGSAIKHDLRSSIVLPLIVNDACIGALSVHASQADIFSEEEVQLLTELANDLAFGIQTLREVMAHQKAEVAKLQAETRYQKLFESLPVGIYRVSGDGRIQDANPALARILGCPNRESLLDMNAKDFFVDASEWETVLQRAQEEDVVHGYVEQLRRPDGKTVWAINSMHISRDADGSIACLEGSLQDITERTEAETALRRAFERIIQTVAATLEVRDPYTAGHQRRVTNLACIIAARMGLSDKNVMALRMAGSIHDLGKISVPAEILSKPSKLTDAEYQLIQEHVEAGYNLLKDIDFPWPVAEIVLQHHERLDGSGYPRGLHGEDILIEAKIIAVADTVEAMSSHRPYRPALGIDVALEEISKDRGVRYDPQVVDACLEVFSDGGFDFEDQSE